MRIEEVEKSKKIFRILKKENNLELNRSLSFDLSEFSILRKGKFFKNINTWKMLEFGNETYLLSLKNSYEIEIVGTAGESAITTDVVNRHNAILMKMEFDLPDLIIRPAYVREKIANIFLNFDVKLTNRNSFNKKYMLESKAKPELLEKIITQNLTNKISEFKEFYLEIINSTILLKFENSINLQDSNQLIEIAKLIEIEIKNVAQ
ncbi:MAG: hypothetical protein WA749_16835 [Gelidibacter sp.]